VDIQVQALPIEYTIEQLLQYRFDPRSQSDLAGHTVGNILLTALWSQGFSTVDGLDILGSMLNVQGRVLPASIEPTVISAKIEVADHSSMTYPKEVIGQVEVASTEGEVVSIALEPGSPAVSTEVIAAIHQSDFLIFGPGSWFTSVVPHLLIADIYSAIQASNARKILVVNLAPQAGETSAYTPVDYLRSWGKFAPEITIDVVIADPAFIVDQAEFEDAVNSLGGSVVWSTMAHTPQSHDPVLLAEAFDKVRAMKRGTSWQ
jgi:uncharacterized cofD-like protein